MAEILVVVDMQNDFVSGVLGTQEAFDIVPQVVGRVVDGLNRGETVLFTRDTHEADYLSTQEGKHLPVPHCIRGVKGGRSFRSCRSMPPTPSISPPLAASTWDLCSEPGTRTCAGRDSRGWRR